MKEEEEEEEEAGFKDHFWIYEENIKLLREWYHKVFKMFKMLRNA